MLLAKSPTTWYDILGRGEENLNWHVAVSGGRWGIHTKAAKILETRAFSDTVVADELMRGNWFVVGTPLLLQVL
jgi:hypothetical protein